MTSIVQRKAYSEVLDILNHTRKEDVEKISPKFMDFLKTHSLQSYISEIDFSTNLKEMHLQSQTWAILAVIYRRFWCNEEERQEFDEKLKVNMLKTPNSQIEFKHQNLFDKVEYINSEIKEDKLQDSKKELIVVKESFWKKIINKVKAFFHR